jgi:hypothetical protein
MILQAFQQLLVSGFREVSLITSCVSLRTLRASFIVKLISCNSIKLVT